MEYVYAAMLLHKASKEINEQNLKKVLEAAGIAADEGKIKSLVAALDGVNIEEAIEKGSKIQAVVAAPAQESGASEKKEDKKEEHKEEVKPEAAAAGLGSLFG